MPWTVYNSNGQILQGSATLANDSVDSQHYVAASIDNEHLADDAVDSDELAAGAVDLAHMSVNSIDSDQYVDGSIDNAHLADDAVGVAELSATGTASSSTFLRGDNAWAAAGGGKVLQVVSTQKSSASGTSSGAWVAISGFSVAITPSATSSKIFVIATDNSLYRGNNSNYYVTLYRNTSGESDANLGHSTGGYLYGYGTTSGAWMSISVLDSPNTTSATTYQIYARVATTGSVDFNNGNAYANITAIEIGA